MLSASEPARVRARGSRVPTTTQEAIASGSSYDLEEVGEELAEDTARQGRTGSHQASVSKRVPFAPGFLACARKRDTLPRRGVEALAVLRGDALPNLFASGRAIQIERTEGRRDRRGHRPHDEFRGCSNLFCRLADASNRVRLDEQVGGLITNLLTKA